MRQNGPWHLDGPPRGPTGHVRATKHKRQAAASLLVAHVRTWLISLTLIVTALAGCSDDGGGDHDDSLLSDDPCADATAADAEGFCGQDAVLDDAGVRDLRNDLTAEDTLKAPKWQVGDVFEQHMYFGKADTAGSHIQTMVIDDAGDCYTIATSDQEAARSESVYDYPILGCIGKQSLETSAFGTDWSWMYEFPLKDGKSWTATIESIINWNTYSFRTFEVTFDVEYDAAIDTPKGDYPGFWITGTTADGEKLLYYNYVPAVGWFSHFWIYDLDSADDPDDIMFHSMSMGTWKGYTGEYYLDESETLVDEFVGFGVNPEDPTSVTGNLDTLPAPIQFDVAETAQHMLGVVVPIAVMGRTDVLLMDPENNYDQYSQENTAEGDDVFSVNFIDRAATAGTWTVESLGVSPFFWGSYVWIEAITEMVYELTEADLPTA